jgi:hypothetical protein
MTCSFNEKRKKKIVVIKQLKSMFQFVNHNTHYNNLIFYNLLPPACYLTMGPQVLMNKQTCASLYW